MSFADSRRSTKDKDRTFLYSVLFALALGIGSGISVYCIENQYMFAELERVNAYTNELYNANSDLHEFLEKEKKEKAELAKQLFIQEDLSTQLMNCENKTADLQAKVNELEYTYLKNRDALIMLDRSRRKTEEDLEHCSKERTGLSYKISVIKEVFGSVKN